jgi:hypothetical protein
MTWSSLSNRLRRINMCSADPNEFAPGSFGIVEEIIDAAMVQRSKFQSGLTERLWRWWEGTSRDGVPRWSSFDITGHSPLAANIYVVRARDDAFQFRLYGERAIQIIGHNPTGEVITSRSPGAISEHLHDYYSRVLAGGQCWRCTGPLLYSGREHRRFESVDIPLIRYGTAPDMILGVIDLLD